MAGVLALVLLQSPFDFGVSQTPMNTTMKKTTNTKTKSPAPATNSAKPAKKKTTGSAKPTLAPTSPVTIKTPVAPVVAASVVTKIVANTDVGFGNALYVRGDGPGLSWDLGKPMQCVANNRWELTLGESARPVSFKVLLNDTTGCTGADSVVPSGGTITITPEFA